MSIRAVVGGCRLALMALVACAATARAADADLQACAARALPERTMRQLQTVTIVSDAGWVRESARTVVWQRFDDGTIKVLFEVKRPPTEAGLKLLVVAHAHEDPVLWVYSPELGRARRVVGSGASNSILGTDFTFEDAQFLQRFLSDGGAHQLQDTEFDGASAFVAEAVMEADTSAYARIRTIIDKTSCLPLKTEFFAANGHLDKTLVLAREQVRAVGGHFIPFGMTMYNHKQSQRTELRASDVVVDGPVPAGLFSLAEIEKSH